MSQRTQPTYMSNIMVEEDPSLIDSDCSENEDAAPPQPTDWSTTIAKIKNDPSSSHSIMVSGVRKLNGVYKCMGVRSQRPYYRKSNADFVIWYDENEDIWILTDSSALTEQDPELYGYIESMAWDVTRVSKDKYWQLADAKGEWIEKGDMQIQKVAPSAGLLSTLLTNPIPESRMAAQAALEQSASLMSSFWGDFKKVQANVKENTRCIDELKTKQKGIQETQRDILGRLEELEKQRNSDVYSDLVKKIEKVEGQVKILYKREDSDLQKRKKKSVKEHIRENSLAKASINAMRTFLKKQRKRRVLLDGKQISVRGTKKELRARIRKLLEQPEERAPETEDEDEEKKLSEVERRKQLRNARELRAAARHKKREEKERRKRDHPARADDRINKKRKKEIYIREERKQS